MLTFYLESEEESDGEPYVKFGKISFVEYRDWAQDTLAVTSLEDVAMSLGMSAPE